MGLTRRVAEWWGATGEWPEGVGWLRGGGAAGEMQGKGGTGRDLRQLEMQGEGMWASGCGRASGVTPVPPFPSPLAAADKAMEEVFNAEYVSLHVRVTNQVAFHMYTNSLLYE